MTNYLFISNSSTFKIDNNIINQVNSILHSENIQFSNKEIKKHEFYEWIIKVNIIEDFVKIWTKIMNADRQDPKKLN